MQNGPARANEKTHAHFIPALDWFKFQQTFVSIQFYDNCKVIYDVKFQQTHKQVFTVGQRLSISFHSSIIIIICTLALYFILYMLYIV